MNDADLERFLAKVECDGQTRCWKWTASRNPKGYGRFQLARRNRLAHQVSYEFFAGPILSGLQIDHLCRVRHCVNPWHMELVTCRENIMRGSGLAAGHALKTHCPQGHPYAGANLYLRPNGWRLCRQCQRERQQRQIRKVNP